MHRGTLLAGLIVGLFVVAIATWMVIGPLTVATYAATLRNARTGETIACSVHAEEREHPLYAFHLCMTTCRARGFEATGPVDNDGIIEFFGTPDDPHTFWAAKIRQYAAYIPAACRGQAWRKIEHVDSPKEG